MGIPHNPLGFFSKQCRTYSFKFQMMHFNAVYTNGRKICNYLKNTFKLSSILVLLSVLLL